MVSSYMKMKTFEERKAEHDNMKRKYPSRTCIYLEKASGSKLPDIDKNKFLVPNDLSVGQMMHVIRKRLTLDATKSIFLFTERNTVPMTMQTIGDLYKEYANADGFLYMTYNTEDTFGGFANY